MAIIFSSKFRVLVALCFTAILGAGCSTTGTTNTVSTDSTTTTSDTVLTDAMTGQPDVYLAFAGGGWRALTAHSAWTIGLLDNQGSSPQQTLGDVFGNVSAVSSNSGGSWFNVMLSYSGDFRSYIESNGASANYLTMPNSYFYREKAFIQNLPEATICRPLEYWDELAFACVLAKGVGGHLNWNDIIHDVVFQPYAMSASLANTTLGNGQRQTWANNKSLLLAATALTNEAVLAESYSLDKYYYSTPQLSPFNIAPVTFSSIAGTHTSAPPFFSGTGGVNPFQLDYSNTVWWGKPPRATAGNNQRNVSTSEINVVTAAAASSAAIGFVGSHAIVAKNSHLISDLKGAWQLAYEGDDLALHFNLPDPSSGKVIRSGQSPTADDKKNATKRYVKMADGGPLDNSGVAQMVAYHQQQHGTQAPFSIVAFDAVQGTYTPVRGSQIYSPTGIDFATLFGQGFTDIGNGEKGFCAGASPTSKGVCIEVADSQFSPQVFDTNGIYTNASWSHKINAQHQLIYTRYDVTTVDSPLMGVTGGTKGTVHAFTTHWADANTAPYATSHNGKRGDKDWAAYEQMFNAVQKGLKSEGGLPYLRAALGLPVF